MRKTTIATLCALASACGGGGSGTIAEQTFQYGAGQPPAYGSDEESAAATARTSLADAAAYVQTGVGSGMPAVGLAGEMASTLSTTGVIVARPVGAASPSKAAPSLAALQTTGYDDPGCVAVTATSIVWTECTITLNDPVNGLSMHAWIDGSITRDPATGLLSWHIDEIVDETITETGGSTMQLHMTAALYGDLTIGPDTIVGSSRQDTAANGRIQGQTLAMSMAAIANVNVGYTTSPVFCITTGTVEVKSQWGTRPAGYTAADLPNEAWLFTWTPDGSGCGAVTVAPSI